MDLDSIKLPRTMDTFGKTIVGLAIAFVTYTVNEIRTDVKQLMTQSNINTTKIENIEPRVNRLEESVFFSKNKTSNLPSKPVGEIRQIAFIKNEDDDKKYSNF